MNKMVGKVTLVMLSLCMLLLISQNIIKAEKDSNVDLVPSDIILYRKDGAEVDGSKESHEGDPHPVCDDDTNVTVVVENYGDDNAFNVEVEFYSNETFIGNYTIDFIPAGENRTAFIIYQEGIEGWREIRAIVDPDNIIQEINESNNECSEQFYFESKYYIDMYVLYGYVYKDYDNDNEYDDGEGIENAKVEIVNNDTGSSKIKYTDEDGLYSAMFGPFGGISYTQGDEIIVTVSFDSLSSTNSFFIYTDDAGKRLDFPFQTEYGIRLEYEIDSATINLTETAVYSITVINTGYKQNQISLTLSDSPLASELSDSSLLLDGNESAVITLSVYTEIETIPGTYIITVHAQSQNDTSFRDNATFNTTVLPEWIISNAIALNNLNITLTGNLTIVDGGNLTFNNINLMINSSYDGEFGIYVDGEFYAHNSTTTAYNNSNRYQLKIYGKMVIEQCDVSYAWIEIFSNETSIVHSIIRNSNKGIFIDKSSPTIEHNLIISNIKGIDVRDCQSIAIRYNNFSYNDVAISSNSSALVIEANTFYHNDKAIDGEGAVIKNNRIMRSTIGIRSIGYNMIRNNNISNCDVGIQVLSSTIVENNHIFNNREGIAVTASNLNPLTNNTIVDSIEWDINFTGSLTLLNTTFNKTKLLFGNNAELTVQWFLNLKVVDVNNFSIADANVTVKNLSGDVVFKGVTDYEGKSYWIVLTEYYQKEDESIYFTPHTVIVEKKDVINEMIVSMEKSRTVTLMLEIAQKMDLGITTIIIQPENPMEDDVLMIYAVVENLGEVYVESLSVKFYVDDAVIDEMRTSIQAGEYSVLSAEWTAIIGEHLIKIIIDEDNEIIESNESNNMAYKSIDVSERFFTFSLRKGWNLISLPLLNYTFSASLLASYIGVECSYIVMRDFNGRYITYIPNFTENDFEIAPNYGYFVFMEKDKNFTIFGKKPKGFSINLYKGWNLIGWTSLNITTAKGLGEMIDGCRYIVKRVAESYTAYIMNFSSEKHNFPIEPGNAYFIYLSRDSVLEVKG